jgi:tRNA(fMet)-specific endonuclease VapC
MIFLDSDHVSVLADMRDGLHHRFVERLVAVREPVAIPVVVLEEHLRGWLGKIRRVDEPLNLVAPYGRLVQLLSFFYEWEIANWTTDAAKVFTKLRNEKVRIGTQDLRIASIALSEKALLLTANLRDFQQVPGLLVEDWLHPISDS